MTATRKVALIGIEGLSLELLSYVTTFTESHYLKRMLDTPAAVFKSTTLGAPASASRWATVTTGVNPGKHGIFDDFKRVPGTYQFVVPNARFRKEPPLWQIINHYGYKVGSFNVPLSYPPEPINGFFVAGADMPGPDSPFTYPNGLYLLLKETFGAYKVDVDYHITDRNSYLQEILQLTTLQFEVFEFLLDKFSKVDAVFAVFTALDRLLHIYDWKNISPDQSNSGSNTQDEIALQILKTFFNRLDKILEKLLEINKNFTIVLTAPYGQQQNDQVIDINQWLLEAGLITLDHAQGDPHPPLIDWQRTYAYSPGRYGHIYLNRKGREPDGVVENGKDAKEIGNRICALLQNKIKDAQKPLILNILKAEDIYSGPYLDSAPDLILELPPGFQVANSLFTHKQDFQSNPEGTSPNLAPIFSHSNCGLVVCHNLNAGLEKRKEHIRLEDITPTLLTLLNIPVPESMDGEPIYTFPNAANLSATKVNFEAKPTNIESLHQLVSNLENALQLKDAEMKVQQHNLASLKKEVETLRTHAANLENHIKLLRAGRVMKLLLWGSSFIQRLKGKLRG